MGFLLEARLCEEPQYLHIKATALGLQFVSEMPLMDEIPESSAVHEDSDEGNTEPDAAADNKIFEELRIAARDPMAGGKASGVAFEESIAEILLKIMLVKKGLL